LRAKYSDLKKGKDNVDYLEKASEMEKNKIKLKEYL
jgi:hypothetical protein